MNEGDSDGDGGVLPRKQTSRILKRSLIGMHRQQNICS